jgi:hypothetical protein
MLFAFCIAFIVGGFVTLPTWSHFSVPVLGAIAGYLVMCAFVTRFPKLGYVDEREIDGLGYVHQPLGVLLLCCVIGFLSLVFRIMR